MNEGFVFVLALAVIGVAVIVVLIRRTPKHSEDTASHHDERPDTTSDNFYGGADRPAGPDAEDEPFPPRAP